MSSTESVSQLDATSRPRCQSSIWLVVCMTLPWHAMDILREVAHRAWCSGHSSDLVRSGAHPPGPVRTCVTFQPT